MSSHPLRTHGTPEAWQTLLGAAVAVLFVVLPTGVSSDARQARVELIGPTAVIPRESYKTWSLFLICNQDWVLPERSADLSGLYWRFKGFGDAIGRDHLAVWFWKRQMPSNDPKLAENVDVARSAQYCGALGLVPSQGPHLVVTNAYPDLAAFPAERAVYELGGLQPAALSKLLGSLTDQLVLQGRVEAKIAEAVGPAAVTAPSLWMRLLEGARQTMVGMGCAVKFAVKAGPLSAELRGCSGELP